MLDVLKNSTSLKKDDIYSPVEVMKILNSDNQEIQRLCKEVNIFPKKDNKTGQIFFFKNDVEILKKIKALHEKTQNIARSKEQSQAISKNLKSKKPHFTNKVEKNTLDESDKPRISKTVQPVAPKRQAASNPIATVNKPDMFKVVDTMNNAMAAFNTTVSEAQDNIVSKLSGYLDEKLDGLDEVIVDLIKCKVENERLKVKVEQLTKDNYDLSIKLNNFTPVAMGLYIKRH